MRGRYLIALVAVTGCADFAGIGDPAPVTPDAPEPSCTIGGLDLCLYARPTNDLVVDDDLMQNTSTDCTIEYFVLPGPPLCVLYARNIDVTATLKAIGGRPLVLVAAEQLTVSGTIDVSSYVNKSPGAGANDASCIRNTSSNETGAGAGGSFAGRGGDAGLDMMGPGGARKLAAPIVSLPDRLRGGCGGDYDSDGGGGIWLAAGESIVLAPSGRLLANGAGGGFAFIGGSFFVAAQGGGSGGLVRIAAPTIQLAGIVTANGGGGAEGSDSSQGRPGSDGLPNTLVAPGGTGGAANGGDGGAGGAGMTPNGVTGSNATGSMAAGGGGGGGVGFIHIVGETVDVASATFSPAPIL